MIFFISLLSMLYNINYFVEYNFILLNSIEVKYLVYFDLIRTLFSSVVLLISSIVLFYSSEYISKDFNSAKLMYLIIFFVISILLIIIRPNLFSILLGWDGLGLTSYCLVIFYQNEQSSSAGIITVLTNRIGDIGILLRFVFSLRISNLNFFFEGLNRSLAVSSYLVFIAALTKRAQLPFSAWLPAAMAAPTPVSSLVHSSTLVTAGVYLLIRFYYCFIGGIIREVLLFVSSLTIFFSGVCALFEIDLKKIIALSTLSQLGIIIIVLSLGNYKITYFHLIFHALYKATIFLRAGIIIHGIGGTQDIRIMGLVWQKNPLLTRFILLRSLSLIGFPFLSGFYSKDLILEMVYFLNLNPYLFLTILVSTLFTVAYSIRLFYFSLFVRSNIGMVCQFHMTRYIKFSVYILGVKVIFIGRIISWIFYSDPILIYLVLRIKILNLSFILLGRLVFFIMLFLAGSEHFQKNHFIGSLFFLPFISRLIFKIPASIFYHFYKFDQTWVEEFGPSSMGVLAVSYSVRLNSNINIRNIIKVLFFFFFFIFFLKLKKKKKNNK